tara:strand:+ start:6052 stop:6240 length:189 start_codon:yes stop_codon:yes gene_type:complete
MKLNKYIILLNIFIFIDLSSDLKILLDHFTFNSFYFTFLNHPLSFFMIFSLPYLNRNLKKYV